MDSKQKLGSLYDYEGGEIRDLRLGIFGTLDYFDKPWGYYLAVASNAFEKAFEIEDQQNFKFVDYRLDIPVGTNSLLSIGKQKEPISMERLMSLVNLPMQERSSVSSALLQARNFGATLHGNAQGDRVSWAAGIFNNFIDYGISFILRHFCNILKTVLIMYCIQVGHQVRKLFCL